MNTSLLILLLSVATLVSAGCSKDSDCPIGPCIFGRCPLSKHHDLMARPCDTKWDCSFFEVCVMGICVGKSKHHEEESALALQTNSLKSCSSSSDCPFGFLCLFGRCVISKKHNLMAKGCDTKWDCSLLEVCVMGICVGKSNLHEEENAVALQTNSLKRCSSSSDCPFNAPCIFGRCSFSKKHNLVAAKCICPNGDPCGIFGCNIPVISNNPVTTSHDLMPKSCNTKWDCSFFEVCVMGFCVGKSNYHEEENAVALQTTNSLKGCSSSDDCPFAAPCILARCVINKKHDLMPKHCDNKWDCKFTEACVMGFCVGI